MKEKILLVVQRYGEKVNGGAEDYVRQYAEKLNAYYEVHVYTTNALSYESWAPYYVLGERVVNDVHIHYFPTKKRHLLFPVALQTALSWPKNKNAGRRFVKYQGPQSKTLIRAIKKNHKKFSNILFFAYLYYPSVYGIKAIKNKAILVPFCHDEPYIYFSIYRNEFFNTKGLIFNTIEEREFVYKLFPFTISKPSTLLGIGIEPPSLSNIDVKKKFGLNNPYIIYVGRLDTAKGVDKLLKYFSTFAKQSKRKIDLVVVGQNVNIMEEELNTSNIKSVGFVDPLDKNALINNSELLVLPSMFESLSIVVLEAFNLHRPILVNEKCQVLKGHILRSNGGLYYDNEEEFVATLNYLLDNPSIAKAMGENGYQYVETNYRWPIIINHLLSFLKETKNDKVS